MAFFFFVSYNFLTIPVFILSSPPAPSLFFSFSHYLFFLSLTHIHTRYNMQFIDRFFLLTRKKQQKQQQPPHDSDTIASTTSTKNNNSSNNNNSKRRKFSFKHLYWISSKNKQQKQQTITKQEDEAIEVEAERNQELLTQCIEAALLSPSTISFSSNIHNLSTISAYRSPSSIATPRQQPQLPNGTYRRNKRWSMVDTRQYSNQQDTLQNYSTRQPTTNVRLRKLSLPPQYSNIGYLASIPEVDSYSFTSDTVPVM